MFADYVKWLRWVGLYLVFLAFPVLLVALGALHSDLVPGMLIGIAAYFIFRRNR